MEAVSVAAGGLSHSVMVSSADGVVVDSSDRMVGHGDPTRRFAAGTLMSEADAGPNGVGTALAEARYVDLVGDEHFIRGFKSHICHGTPIVTPRREVAGALCLSTRDVGLVDELLPLFSVASRGVEAELQASFLREKFMELRAMPDHEAHELAALHQDLVQKQMAAQLQVALAARRFRTPEGARLVGEATESLTAFLGGASAFRLASGAGGKAFMSAAEFLLGVESLLEVEARSARVAIAVVVQPKGGFAVDSALARRVIAEARDAIASAARMKDGRVVLREEGTRSVAVEVFADGGWRQGLRVVAFGSSGRE